MTIRPKTHMPSKAHNRLYFIHAAFWSQAIQKSKNVHPFIGNPRLYGCTQRMYVIIREALPEMFEFKICSALVRRKVSVT